MCGIAGIFNLEENINFDFNCFTSSMSTMQHRGPDSKAAKVVNQNLILGHLRLSIIDLNEISNQPFQIDNKYWIVFNGEIYNYIELKDELKVLGYTFITKGDTEVLLKSYQEWGEECVTKFNGMWAFAIFDVSKNKLFCSRDRFGVKPFNYAIVNNQLIFSSEIKFIINYFPNLKKPNYNIIANYCRTSIGAQIKETWFENILRLQPAHNLSVENGTIRIYRYWDYPKIINKKISFNDAIFEYKKIFTNSVDIRMRSDVPVGFTLSSGIDSTSLVCKVNNAKNLNTYTAAFDNKKFFISEKRNFKENVTIDEANIVNRLTKELGMNSNIIQIDYQDYTKKLQNIIHFLESGHGSPAIYPLFQVLEFAKKDVTVVIEGQGADELLAGYVSNFTPIYIYELLLKLKLKKAYHVFKGFATNYSLKTAIMLLVRNANISILNKLYFKLTNKDLLFIGKLKYFNHVNDYPSHPKGFNNLLNNFLFKAHTGGLVNLLHYGDAISMAHSIESRLPFMDYRLVEFVFTLPSEFKINNKFGKYIHREAMKGVVPDYILNNPLKFGFDSPLSHLFCSTEENSPFNILMSEKSLSRELFSRNILLQIFNDQFTRRKDNSRLLYRLLSVELWFREFIDYD